MGSAAQHGLIQQNHILYQQGMNIPASSAEYILTKEIAVSDAASLYFAMFVDIENVNVGGGEEIKFYLQKLVNGEWCNVGDPQATFLANNGDGTYCIVLNTDLEIEAMVLPLTNVVRLTVDTGATSTARVTKVTVFDRL